MKNNIKVLAVCASPRKGSTQKHVEFAKRIILEVEPEAEIDIVLIKDMDIKLCLGCTACYDKSELNCPLKDDLQSIVQKMRWADGVILSSPTYVMNVSGLMKNFIDRLSYVCHRSEFFKKETMLMTTCAGKIGSVQALKSLEFASNAWGFHTASRLSIVTGHYTPHDAEGKNKKMVENKIRKFVRAIRMQAYKKPSFTALAGFKYRQICYRKAVHEGMGSYDLSYWLDKGLLDKGVDYFFPLPPNPVKKAAVLIATHALMLFAG